MRRAVGLAGLQLLVFAVLYRLATLRIPFTGLAGATLVLACQSDRPTPPGTAAVIPVEQNDGEPIRIMPLGDSITQADADHDSYRRPLWKSLRAEGFNVDFVGSQTDHHRGPPPRRDFDVDHEGHWGWRVDEVLERAAGWVEAQRPDIILIHLGSNDVFQRQSNESTLAELSELIDAIRALRPRTTFLLAQILPTTTPAATSRIAELNARIPPLAESKSTADSPVIVVDQFTGFDPATATYDGVHPNAGGEIHMSERWLDALQSVLE